MLIELYLSLMKKSLVGYLEQDGYLKATSNKIRPFDPACREVGSDWPTKAMSMIGMRRMSNLQQCAENVIHSGVKGNFIETGVWRGGACMFMQAVLKAYDETKTRKVYVADSFKGMPAPKSKGDINLTSFNNILSVSLDTVKNNFKRYDLLDDNVVFVEGYFEDTLPMLSDKWAILRLDGDMYSSTKVALNSLYHNLSIGGYIIVDDYNCLKKSVKKCIHFSWKIP